MAVPKDKKLLFNTLVPEVNFTVSHSGIRIESPRLNAPRFLPFDAPGRCKSCKNNAIELDHLITTEGVHLFSNRIKNSKFVPFDEVRDFPNHAFFRLRAGGHTYEVQQKQEVNNSIERKAAVLTATKNGAGKRGGRKRPVAGVEKGQTAIDNFLRKPLKKLKVEGGYDTDVLDEFLVFDPNINEGTSKDADDSEVITLDEDSEEDEGNKENDEGL